MSVFEDVTRVLDSVSRAKDETIEQFACRLYTTQARAYDGWMAGDGMMSWELLSSKRKRHWLQQARKRSRNKSA